MTEDETLPEVPTRKLRSDTNVQNQGSDDDSDNEYFVIQTVPKVLEIPNSSQENVHTDRADNSSPDGTIAQPAIVELNVDDSADTNVTTSADASVDPAHNDEDNTNHQEPVSEAQGEGGSNNSARTCDIT